MAALNDPQALMGPEGQMDNEPMGPEGGQMDPQGAPMGPEDDPMMVDGQLPEGDLEGNLKKEMSPAKKKQLKNIQAMLTDMLYHPDTKQSVQSMLKSSPPHVSIPGATNAVFQKFEDMATQKNKKPMPLDVRLTSGVMLFSEIMELSEDMEIVPEDLPEREIQGLLKDTMQQYIQKGLKTKSIDPIELQQAVEPMMSEEERQIGLEMGAAHGTPTELSSAVAAEGMYQKRVAPMEAKTQALQQSNKQMQGALQGIAMKPEEDEGGA